MEKGEEKTVVMGWKSMKDMTADEIRKLPRCLAEVSMVTFEKTGVTRYNLVLRLFNKCVDVQFRLKQSAFYIIRKIWNVADSADKFSISCPYRLVRCKGIDKETGEEYDYYYVEVLPVGQLNKHIYFNSLLGGDQADEIKELGFHDDKTIFDRGNVVRDTVAAQSEFLDYSTIDN